MITLLQVAEGIDAAGRAIGAAGEHGGNEGIALVVIGLVAVTFLGAGLWVYKSTIERLTRSIETSNERQGKIETGQAVMNERIDRQEGLIERLTASFERGAAAQETAAREMAQLARTQERILDQLPRGAHALGTTSSGSHPAPAPAE